MRKAIRAEKLTDTLTLSERKDGFWLYDTTETWHIAARAESRDEAFIKAIEYYRHGLREQKKRKYEELRRKVEGFVTQFAEDAEIE